MNVECFVLGHQWGIHEAMICQRKPVPGAAWRKVKYIDCLRCNKRQAEVLGAEVEDDGAAQRDDE